MKPGEDTEEALWAKYSAPTKTAVATADDSEDALWAKYGGAQAATPPKRGIVIGSLARGIDNLQSSMYGAGALMADSADAIDAREFMLEGYFRNVREAQENPARIESFRKIEGVGDAFTYAIEGIFENIPSMIPSMVTGGGAYVLAGVGGKALAAGIGAYAGNWAQEAGSIYGDIAERTGERRPGTAAGYGAAAAALDTLSELMPLTKLMPLGEKRAIAGALGQGVANEIQRRLAARVARGAGQQFLTESATEAMQTAIEEAAVHHVDPSKPFWTAELMDRIVDAGLKGGIAGGALGAVAGAIPQEKPVPMGGQQEKPEDQKATDDAVLAANAALEAGAPQTAAALTEADVADIEEPVDVTPPVATEPEQPVDVTPSPEPEPTVDVTPPPPAEPEPPIPIPQTQAELDQEGGVELETQEKGQEELPVAQPTTPAVTAPGPVEAPAPAQAPAAEAVATPEEKKTELAFGDVYQTEIKGRGTMFAVRGESQSGFGDELHGSESEALTASERMVRRKSEKELASKRQAELDAEEKRKEFEATDLGGFTSGMTPMTSGRAKKTLSQRVAYKGSPTSIRDLIRNKVSEGWRVVTENRERRLQSDGGTFLSQKALTKTGLDYAAWLASQKPAPVAPVATPAVAEVPTQQPDPIDAALTRAIDATSQRGEVNDFVKGVSYAAANAILRIARALYRGGKKLAEAIREAIRQYREDNPTSEFDAEELSQKLEALGIQQDLVEPAPPTPPTRQESGTPLKQSKALEFIRDPQFWYRAATDNGRREIAEDLARFFADDLEAAIQYLVSPPPSAGLRQDVQAASLAIIADTAMTRSLQATETFERGRLAAIGRHAIVQTKRIGSKMGQVLQGFGLTHDILGAGFFVADYQSWLEEKQRTAMSDEAAVAVAGAVKTHTTDPQQVANDRRSILEELAETDPMAAAVLELTEMGRGAFNLVTGKGFTPDYAKRLGKLFKNLPGWRDIYADKGGKKLDKLFWQLLRAGDDVQKSGSVDTMYKNVVSELSRLLRQALQASNDAKPINKFAELVRVMGEGQSRIEIILKLDEYIQQNAATLENADEILAAWDEAFGILRNPASKTTMRALLRDTIRGRETETDWDALFDSGQDGPAVRQLVDETIARLRAVETSETIDFEPLRAALLTEANAIRDAKFKLWEKRTRDVSTNKAKARTDGKRAIGRLERIINELRRDDIGISWREFFAQPVESQKDLTRKIFERLTEFGHLQRANRLDLANEIAAQLRIIFNVVAEVNIEREIKRLTKVPDDQRRIAADVVPELIRLSNAGVLDFSAARNAMAEKLGVKAISEATSQQIFEMGQAAQRRPAGSQRSEAYRKIFNLIQREAGISAWDVTKSFWYWGVLTGIGTQAANLMGSTSNLLLQLATYSARSPKDAARAFQAAMRGFRDSALQEFPAIFLRGAEPRRQRTDIEGAATTSEVMAEDEASKWNKIFKVQRYTTRFMMAVDQLLYDASHEVRAVMDVALKARESNPQITREAIDKQVADYLHLTDNETRIARAQAQAEIDEGLTNPQDLERRTTEIIRQKRSLDLQETSNKFGLETTLNNEPDGVMGALYRIVISLREQYPIFWPLVPFAKISANVTNLFMTMSPIGMIMVLRNRPGAHQNWRWMEKLGIKHREMTVAEWQQLRASVALSNIVAIGILIAVLSEEDEEDPWIQVTGSMRGIPPNKKFQLQEMGVKPYQIKINGASFDYRLTPGAMLLAMIGNFMDARKYGKKDEDAWGPLEAVLSAGHGVIIDQQFLSGLAGLVSSGENAGKSMVTRLFEGAGRMTGGFIPSITKEIDSWVNPTIPQADGFLETFQRQVPVWRWSLDPPIRNALGEPIERPRLPWGRVVSFDKDLDPVWEVLREKSRAGVFIPTVSKAAKINGKPMTDAQFDKYQTITGRLYRQKLLADLPRLRRMTPAQTKEYFDKEFGRLREQARNQIR